MSSIEPQECQSLDCTYQGR